MNNHGKTERKRILDIERRLRRGVTGVTVGSGGSGVTLPITESDVTNLVSDLAAKVPTTRTISTTSPLTGGGDLSANRTFAINAASTSASGIVELATDGETAASVVVQGNDTRLVNFSRYKEHQFKNVDAPYGWTCRAGSADVVAGTEALDDTDSRWYKFTTGAVSGNEAGRNASGTPGNTRAARSFIQHSRMKTGTSLTAVKFFIGQAYGNIVQGFGIDGYYAMGFMFASTTDASNWLGYTANNTNRTITTLSAIATSTVYHLTCDASTYPTDGAVKFYINDVLAGTQSSPTSVVGAQDLDPQTMIKTSEAVAKHFYIGPQHLEQY